MLLYTLDFIFGNCLVVAYCFIFVLFSDAITYRFTCFEVRFKNWGRNIPWHTARTVNICMCKKCRI